MSDVPTKLSASYTLNSAKALAPIKTGIVHPVEAYTITSAKEAADEQLIEPVLIGPKARILLAAQTAQIDISGWQLIDTEHSHAAAAMACNMAGAPFSS